MNITRSVICSIYVKGQPKGQPRPRAFVRGGRAAVFDPGTSEGWKGQIALAFREFENRKVHAPMSLLLTFHMPRPAGHLKKNGEIKPAHASSLFTGKPDADNLAKAVMDALTSLGVWTDDSLVVTLIARKRYESKLRPPGCEIEIHELSEDPE
jgi:Holliday junction resolvase RusA-like endonuclease